MNPTDRLLGPRAQRCVRPAKSIDTVKLLRSRYPQGLICTVCALLLATRPESYSRSNITEEQRLNYVCSECRLEAAEAERLRASRVQNLAHARAAKRRRAPTRGRMRDRAASTRETRPGGGGFLSPEPESRQPGDQGRHGAKGGRPRKHPTARAAHAAAQRAYRARERALAV